MRKVINCILCLISGNFLLVNAQAKNIDPNDYALMSAHDVVANTLSNITITNHTTQPITVSGLFIASFDINDCSSCYGSVVSGNNMGGSIASRVTFAKDQAVAIGQNYLYNMLYNGIYYIKTTVGSSPCSLPGCSWPGDDPTVRGWCITINAVSLDSNYTSSTYTNGSNPPASLPAYAQAATSGAFNYNYALIDPMTLGAGGACLGPVVCNDKTLTCKVSSAQNESFQAY